MECHMHNMVTRGLGDKHCTGMKCNPHGVDIPFFVFFRNFFAVRTDTVFRACPQFFHQMT